MGTFEISNIPLVPLLFQAGYLTITEYHKQNDSFKLDYPNREVRESFNRYLLQALTKKYSYVLSNLLENLKQSLETNNVDTFCTLLKSLFAHIPYYLHINQEKYFHSLLQIAATLMGFKTLSELPTDKGRIDLVINTKKFLYLFELKYNANPEIALTERFMAQEKQIVLVGLTFKRADNKLDLACKTEFVPSNRDLFLN